MEMYYVATRECHALVPAVDGENAWIVGHDALHMLHAELAEQTGLEVPIEIRTVRLATAEEISDWYSNEDALLAHSEDW